MNYLSQINLQLKHKVYLEDISECQPNITSYECMALFINNGNYSKCPKPCIPFLMQQFTKYEEINSLPICTSYNDSLCMDYLMYEAFLYAWGKCSR